jgi:hypothetical protein
MNATNATIPPQPMPAQMPILRRLLVRDGDGLWGGKGSVISWQSVNDSH